MVKGHFCARVDLTCVGHDVSGSRCCVLMSNNSFDFNCL